MDDPIKVILKYKNNERKVQYHQYIYVGWIDKTLMGILNKIKELSFYESLIELSEKDFKKIEKEYGDKWYNKIFNKYHILDSIKKIKKDDVSKKKLKKKMGDKWYSNNISNYKLNESLHSFESNVINEKKDQIDERKASFTTNKNENIHDLTNELSREVVREDNNTMEGGKLKNIIKGFHDPINKIKYIGGAEEPEKVIEEVEEKDETELDSEELTDEELRELYTDVDVKDIDNTSKMIKSALDDEKYFDKIEEKLISFDTSKDTIVYDDELKNVYSKKYVTNQYIFKDDTIKTLKYKITCSIKNNPVFGKKSYILPSRQYLWLDYLHQNKIKKAMIGQKWIAKNSLLDIDIEPNSNLRVYEDLRKNLRELKNELKRYGSKIRREDDDNAILYDYEDYLLNNEIYMVDVYNELGYEYKPGLEELRNITDVYLKLYFPKIKTNDIKHILDYVNNKSNIEESNILTSYESINNDLTIENEVMKDVELTKKNDNYKYLFKENYITQSVIHVNLYIIKKENEFEDLFKLDLHEIFDNFDVDYVYPFIHYQRMDSSVNRKMSDKDIRELANTSDGMDIINKWIENKPDGISFKVRLKNRVNKFMAITLKDNGKIEYKTQWKMEDKATIDDIKDTYVYIRDLIEKINNNMTRVKLNVPDNSEFKFAFMNTIQSFVLSDDKNYVIDHNKLSEFSRYFFPYVAMVIEPRKRQAKIQKERVTGKFGTYLRYKRVSRYENKQKIEQRILYFMRNYEHTDKTLADVISKQFNITLEKALEEIEHVKKNIPVNKKARKVLKKLHDIPKYKPPGISIDIQGRSIDEYKMKISGARTKEQLDRMLTFMNILIFLYVETYHKKKPERQILKEKLKKLNNIARRRNRVDEIVREVTESRTIKDMVKKDKKRLGFKPEKGQNQWSRACQNSGDKRRQPHQYITSGNPDELMKQGYKMNNKTGMYEKKAFYTDSNGNKKQTTLRSVRLIDYDDNGQPTGENIYYTCSPKDNGEYMYVGFLTKSRNPHGQCMPCCFKKDPYISANKTKRDFFRKCIEEKEEIDINKEIINMGDILYILQDTNKIQQGRLSFLPDLLDKYFNIGLNKDIQIKNHLLMKAEKGYFFKLGVYQEEYEFLNAIAEIYNVSFNELKKSLIDVVKKDKNNRILTSLNNGNILTKFETRDKFIKYIENSLSLDFEMMNNLLSIPGIISKNGVNINVFEKHVTVISKNLLEKSYEKEDFVLLCQDNEDTSSIDDPKKDNIFLLKDGRNYYPIVMINKNDPDSKDYTIEKIFKKNNDEDNVVTHFKDFFNKNCGESILNQLKENKNKITAKNMRYILENLGQEFSPKYQVIDSHNKCKYLITENKIIVPVTKSGTLWDIYILKDITPQLDTLSNTIDKLVKLNKLIHDKIKLKPIGVIYENIDYDAMTVVVNSLFTIIDDVIPIKPEKIKIDKLLDKGFLLNNEPLYDKIDIEIEKNSFIPDERVEEVKFENYKLESYQMFRFNLSEYLSNNEKIKNDIMKIITNKDIKLDDKRTKIKKILFKIIDNNLLDIYNEVIKEDMNKDNIQSGGGDKIIHMINKPPDLKDYTVINNRKVCRLNDKNKCDGNYHCYWYRDKCYLGLTKEMIIEFVGRVVEEFIDYSLKSKELLAIGDYNVQKVVSYNKFTNKSGQTIVKSDNYKIRNILEDLLGKDNVTKIDKLKKIERIIDENKLNVENPLRDMIDFFSQNIIENNNTYYRAFVNGFFWLKHPYYDPESRNLGYYSEHQSSMANYMKSRVIDWLSNSINDIDIEKHLSEYIDDKRQFILESINNLTTETNGVVEYYILNKIVNIPINIIDDNNDIIYFFNDGFEYNHKKDKKEIKKQINDSYNDYDIITIRFSFITEGDIPDEVDIIYPKNYKY